jgi:hypothetical protein
MNRTARKRGQWSSQTSARVCVHKVGIADIEDKVAQVTGRPWRLAQGIGPSD